MLKDAETPDVLVAVRGDRSERSERRSASLQYCEGVGCSSGRQSQAAALRPAGRPYVDLQARLVVFQDRTHLLPVLLCSQTQTSTG